MIVRLPLGLELWDRKAMVLWGSRPQQWIMRTTWTLNNSYAHPLLITA